ncbi:uncharacterized protein LOC120678064 [Panicum virgatum]|uniref:uncharacterized protein LOC120678064 n=1 Tax=Panicum virgatum TaxID=38727 RepID=UPI0019D69AD1|nr:uncharacterized protein LOC120678064 [Panicum virgatum]
MDLIAVATATSGIAASIMPGGRTAHSRFKIPIKLSGNNMCSFTKQSGTAELLRKASLIIWDEVAMTKRQAVEALDRSLRDIMSCDMPFGGRLCCLVVTSDRLTHNMRAQADTWFEDYLLRIGNGTEEAFEGDYVWLPDDILIHNPLEDDSIYILIDQISREQKIFYRFDSVDDDSRNNYPLDFLNLITPNGLPPHELKV